MFIRFMLMSTLTFMPFFVGYGVDAAFATPPCSVKAIVKLVHKGNDRNKIRRKCAKVNVKKCSLTKVVKLATKGLTARAITKRCN